MRVSFKKRIIISFTIIVASLAVCGVAIGVTHQSLLVEAQKIKDARVRLRDKYWLQNLFVTFERDKVIARNYGKRLDSIFPDKDNVIYLREWFEEMALVYDVKIDVHVGSETASTESAPGHVGFRISARGKRTSLMQFLINLEKNQNRFLVGIDSFSYQDLGGENYQLAGEGRAFFK